MQEEKITLYRYAGETKPPLQIENEDGSYTIVKLIKDLILTQEVISPDKSTGSIDPLCDIEFFKKYDIQVEVVED